MGSCNGGSKKHVFETKTVVLEHKQEGLWKLKVERDHGGSLQRRAALLSEELKGARDTWCERFPTQQRSGFPMQSVHSVACPKSSVK